MGLQEERPGEHQAALSAGHQEEAQGGGLLGHAGGFWPSAAAEKTLAATARHPEGRLAHAVLARKRPQQSLCLRREHPLQVEPYLVSSRPAKPYPSRVRRDPPAPPRRVASEGKRGERRRARGGERGGKEQTVSPRNTVFPLSRIATRLDPFRSCRSSRTLRSVTAAGTSRDPPC